MNSQSNIKLPLNRKAAVRPNLSKTMPPLKSQGRSSLKYRHAHGRHRFELLSNFHLG